MYKWVVYMRDFFMTYLSFNNNKKEREKENLKKK